MSDSISETQTQASLSHMLSSSSQGQEHAREHVLEQLESPSSATSAIHNTHNHMQEQQTPVDIPTMTAIASASTIASGNTNENVDAVASYKAINTNNTNNTNRGMDLQEGSMEREDEEDDGFSSPLAMLGGIKSSSRSKKGGIYSQPSVMEEVDEGRGLNRKDKDKGKCKGKYNRGRGGQGMNIDEGGKDCVSPEDDPKYKQILPGTLNMRNRGFNNNNHNHNSRGGSRNGTNSTIRIRGNASNFGNASNAGNTDLGLNEEDEEEEEEENEDTEVVSFANAAQKVKNKERERMVFAVGDSGDAINKGDKDDSDDQAEAMLPAHINDNNYNTLYNTQTQRPRSKEMLREAQFRDRQINPADNVDNNANNTNNAMNAIMLQKPVSPENILLKDLKDLKELKDQENIKVEKVEFQLGEKPNANPSTFPANWVTLCDGLKAKATSSFQPDNPGSPLNSISKLQIQSMSPAGPVEEGCLAIDDSCVLSPPLSQHARYTMSQRAGAVIREKDKDRDRERNLNLSSPGPGPESGPEIREGNKEKERRTTERDKLTKTKTIHGHESITPRTARTDGTKREPPIFLEIEGNGEGEGCDSRDSRDSRDLMELDLDGSVDVMINGSIEGVVEGPELCQELTGNIRSHTIKTTNNIKNMNIEGCSTSITDSLTAAAWGLGFPVISGTHSGPHSDKAGHLPLVGPNQDTGPEQVMTNQDTDTYAGKLSLFVEVIEL